MSRQAYYKGLQQQEREVLQEALIIELVQGVRRNNKQMGGKKLYHLLAADIHHIDGGMGRDKFFDLLRRHELLIERRRKYAVTTQSWHRFYVYKNLILDFKAERPHQLWVSDITYIRMDKGFAYLFLITDAYSRKIVGWHVSDSLAMEGALRALEMAIQQCPATGGLIHHSDRGFQYCSHAYVNLLTTNQINISMAAAGNCYENAMAERVNGILKQEYALDETYADKKEVVQAVQAGIQAYNEQRPHWALNLQIPAVVHQAA